MSILKKHRKDYYIYEYQKGGKWRLVHVESAVSAFDACELWLGSLTSGFAKQHSGKRKIKHRFFGVSEVKLTGHQNPGPPKNIKNEFVFMYDGW